MSMMHADCDQGSPSTCIGSRAFVVNCTHVSKNMGYLTDKAKTAPQFSHLNGGALRYSVGGAAQSSLDLPHVRRATVRSEGGKSQPI
jgi:hypothetical protein